MAQLPAEGGSTDCKKANDLDDCNPITYNHPETTGYHANGVDNSEDSSSESESSTSDEESEEESDSSEEEMSEEMQLKSAGVTLDLKTLGSPIKGCVAPLELLSEFVSCCVRNEYSAALILCNKVLEFEPNNQTAKQFLPVLQERLKLDEELSTESSEESQGESDDEIPTPDIITCNHNC